MSYPYHNNASWAQQPTDAAQYPPAQQSAAYPPPGYPGAQPLAHPPPAPVQHYPMAAPAGDPAAAWQQQPTGCWQASSSSTVDGPQWPQQQQQQQYVEQQSQGAVGPDGSRGLGSFLLGAGHKVHKVGLAMHHIAHPVQGLKYHTVDKVKRKVKGKLCHLVDKVVP